MNSIRFYQELCRRTVSLNLTAEELSADRGMCLTFEGMPICRVLPDGVITYSPEQLNTEERKEVYWQLDDISEEVKTYVRAIEDAPTLKAADLRDGYKLLCEHGNIVFAGKDMGVHGYQFVTWQYTYDRKGVTLGHYYHNNYCEAKEEFAVRSGLIDKHRLFEPEELKEIYRVLDQDLQYNPDLTYDQGYRVMELKEKLERIAPKVIEDYRAGLAEIKGTINDDLHEEDSQQEDISEAEHGPTLSMQNS